MQAAMIRLNQGQDRIVTLPISLLMLPQDAPVWTEFSHNVTHADLVKVRAIEASQRVKKARKGTTVSGGGGAETRENAGNQEAEDATANARAAARLESRKPKAQICCLTDTGCKTYMLHVPWQVISGRVFPDKYSPVQTTLRSKVLMKIDED